MRQQPETLPPAGGDPRARLRWRAWGLCDKDGALGEVTLDRDKADKVWRRGGHRVIEFVHEEPAPPAAAVTP